ncbi:MAG: hypothetical protein MHM6MM_000888 [Cercozoa sp. M6MM]
MKAQDTGAECLQGIDALTLRDRNRKLTERCDELRAALYASRKREKAARRSEALLRKALEVRLSRGDILNCLLETIPDSSSVRLRGLEKASQSEHVQFSARQRRKTEANPRALKPRCQETQVIQATQHVSALLLLRAKVATLTDENSELQHQLKACKKEIQDSRKSGKDAVQREEYLQHEVQTLSQQLEAVRAQNEELARQTVAMKNASAILRAQVSDANEKLLCARADLESFKQNNADVGISRDAMKQFLQEISETSWNAKKQLVSTRRSMLARLADGQCGSADEEELKGEENVNDPLLKCDSATAQVTQCRFSFHLLQKEIRCCLDVLSRLVARLETTQTQEHETRRLHRKASEQLTRLQTQLQSVCSERDLLLKQQRLLVQKTMSARRPFRTPRSDVQDFLRFKRKEREHTNVLQTKDAASAAKASLPSKFPHPYNQFDLDERKEAGGSGANNVRCARRQNKLLDEEKRLQQQLQEHIERARNSQRRLFHRYHPAATAT